MEKDYYFRINWPPSVNGLYGFGGRDYRNPHVYIKYKNKLYIDEMICALKIQAKKQGLFSPITDFVKITTNAYPPDKRKRDLRNLFKVEDDLLVKAQILKDDSLIKKCESELFLFDKETKIRGLEIKLSLYEPSTGKF